jgi:hypothetical protein
MRELTTFPAHNFILNETDYFSTQQVRVILLCCAACHVSQCVSVELAVGHRMIEVQSSSGCLKHTWVTMYHEARTQCGRIALAQPVLHSCMMCSPLVARGLNKTCLCAILIAAKHGRGACWLWRRAALRAPPSQAAAAAALAQLSAVKCTLP